MDSVYLMQLSTMREETLYILSIDHYKSLEDHEVITLQYKQIYTVFHRIYLYMVLVLLLSDLWPGNQH